MRYQEIHQAVVIEKRPSPVLGQAGHRVVTLTKEMIEAACKDRAGYKRADTDAIGVDWPLRSGWLKRLVGRTVPLDGWLQFSSAKPKPRPPKKAARTKKPRAGKGVRVMRTGRFKGVPVAHLPNDYIEWWYTAVSLENIPLEISDEAHRRLSLGVDLIAARSVMENHVPSCVANPRF